MTQYDVRKQKNRLYRSLHYCSTSHTAPDLWEEWERSQEFYQFKLRDEGTEEFNTTLYPVSNMSDWRSLYSRLAANQIFKAEGSLVHISIWHSSLGNHAFQSSFFSFEIWSTVFQKQKFSFHYHTPPFGMIIHDREVRWIGRSWAGHSFGYIADTLKWHASAV